MDGFGSLADLVVPHLLTRDALQAGYEEGWALLIEIFRACRSRRGDKGRNDRKFLEVLHS